MVVLWIAIALIVILACIVTINTISFKPEKLDEKGMLDNDVKLNVDAAAEKLSKAIQTPTISNSDYSKTDWKVFDKYIELMKELFPLVHEKLDLEMINKYSFVFHWKGKNSEIEPVLFTAHYDVVPIEVGTEGDWTYPPFSGEIADGILWGRGAIDTKITMITALEAVEQLLKEDFVPQQDIYLAFGHDEEVGGYEGAEKISLYFKEKNISFKYLLDEGGVISKDSITGVNKPVALVGVAEKGYANIKITVKDAGGHASTPPRHTSLGLIAKVISNIENKQLPLRLIPSTKEFMKVIGREMSGINRVILANLWLFKPIFLNVFSKTKSGNALLRTTTAATMAEGSMEPNVLPQSASAIFNFRIIPNETGKGLIEHIKKVNKGIPIEIEALRLEDPSQISSVNSEGFNIIKSCIQTNFGDVAVAPYLVLAGTDARKYERVCKNIYRFAPILVDQSEINKIHNTNESISVDNIGRSLRFYMNLIKK